MSKRHAYLLRMRTYTFYKVALTTAHAHTCQTANYNYYPAAKVYTVRIYMSRPIIVAEVYLLLEEEHVASGSL